MRGIPGSIPSLDNYRVDENGCWLWLGALCRGYGRVGKSEYAHREIYEREHGPIPDGLTLDHYRLNPGPREAPCSRACVNPDHVEVVSHRENCKRGHAGKRNAARTHCPQGHPYSPENTKLYQGRRYCKACGTCYRREAKRRKRAQRALARMK